MVSSSIVSKAGLEWQSRVGEGHLHRPVQRGRPPEGDERLPRHVLQPHPLPTRPAGGAGRPPSGAPPRRAAPPRDPAPRRRRRPGRTRGRARRRGAGPASRRASPPSCTSPRRGVARGSRPACRAGRAGPGGSRPRSPARAPAPRAARARPARPSTSANTRCARGSRSSPASVERHAPGAAHEQVQTKRLLQALHLLRQRRLGDVQLLGGAGEVSVCRHGGEVAQLAQLHWRR